MVIGGNLSVTGGTDSSSYNTGSFTTAGGLGVQKNANFSQNIYVGGAGQISGTLSYRPRRHHILYHQQQHQQTVLQVHWWFLVVLGLVVI